MNFQSIQFVCDLVTLPILIVHEIEMILIKKNILQIATQE